MNTLAYQEIPVRRGGVKPTVFLKRASQAHDNTPSSEAASAESEDASSRRLDSSHDVKFSHAMTTMIVLTIGLSLATIALFVVRPALFLSGIVITIIGAWLYDKTVREGLART